MANGVAKAASKTVSFKHNDVEYTVRKKLRVDALSLLEEGKAVQGVKKQLGDDQFKQFVASYDGGPDVDDLDALLEDMLDAMGVDRGK